MSPADDAAQAVRDFAEALAAPLPDDTLRFDARVDMSVMALYESILGELQLHQFGDPERHEYFAEQLTRRLHRDATITPPFPLEFASRSGE